LQDRELINRFCAFQLLPLDDYQNGMDEWMGTALRKMNELDLISLKELFDKFENSLTNNAYLFRRDSFSIRQINRPVFSAPLWDVMITGLAKYSIEQVANHAEEIKARFYALIADEKFLWSITSGPNHPDRVKYRFKETQKMFAEVFDAHSS
jgi:hypothetical protein